MKREMENVKCVLCFNFTLVEAQKLWLNLDQMVRCCASEWKISEPCYHVAAKTTYIRLLRGKIGFLGFFLGPSSIKRGRTHIVLG